MGARLTTKMLRRALPTSCRPTFETCVLFPAPRRTHKHGRNLSSPLRTLEYRPKLPCSPGWRALVGGWSPVSVKTYESGFGHVRKNIVFDGKTPRDRKIAFGMARVFLDLPKGCRWPGQAMTVVLIRCSCVTVVVLWVGVACDNGGAKHRSHALAKWITQELLSRICVRFGHKPLTEAEVVRDVGLLRLAVFVLSGPMEVVNVQVASP